MKISHLSNKQRNYAVIMLAIAAVFGVFLNLNQQQDSSEQRNVMLNTDSSEILLKQTKTIVMANAALPDTSVKKMRVIKKPDVEKFSTIRSSAPEPAWTVGDVKSATPTFTLNENVSQYEIVKIENPEIYPAVGQTISLPMLKGKNVTVNVQSAATLQNGDYSWSGHLEGFGDDFPVVMTYGPHSIFATITTPEGSYSMESIDGAGWLYKNPSEFELMKPGSNDYVEVNDAQ